MGTRDSSVDALEPDPFVRIDPNGTRKDQRCPQRKPSRDRVAHSLKSFLEIMRTMRTVLFLAFFFVLQFSAFSDDLIPPEERGERIRVPEEVRTIQRAIRSASNGDTIVVAPGTYRENLDFLGKRIILKSEKGPGATIIDGRQQGSVVEFENGEGRLSILNGFTLTNGYGMVYSRSSGDGGAIYCDGSSPTIVNNIITGNFASSGYGGGLFIKSDSSPIVAFNTITGNESVQCGGAIYCRSSSPYIFRNTITHNRSMTGYGGAITLSLDSDPYIVSNTILHNWSKSGGGGICVYQSSPSIAGNVIARNGTISSGGGLLIFWNSDPNVISNTITRNSAIDGGGLACMNHSSVAVHNSILWDNEAHKNGSEIYVGRSTAPATMYLSYSNVNVELGSIFTDTNCQISIGAGIISSNPYFVDPSKDDYHLTIYSPCVNAGDNDSVISLSKDNDGDPRVAPIQDGTTDIGADEFYQHLYIRGAVQSGGEIDLVAIGIPNLPATLYIRPLIEEPHGGGGGFNSFTLWDEMKLGPIPLSGALNRTIPVPSSAIPGDRYRLFVLEGYFGSEPQIMTNEIDLTIE